MSTREILTLQFGHYANYIGAHFWNLQELSFDYTGTVKTEVNHDILYREGKTATGEVTYTPRLLLADLKGSLKTLPESGGLPEEPQENEFQWNAVEKIEDPAPAKNEYLADIDGEGPSTVETKQYNLENDVNTWTDYLYPRLHARSVNIVREYVHGNESESFDINVSGKGLWKGDFGDAFSDNIRKYVEECDSMQGFQVNFDCTNGFSGLAVGCLEYLADEYTKPILAHPIIPSYFPDNNTTTQEDRDKANIKDSTRLVNTALAIQELSEHATLFVPLCTGDKGWRKPGTPRKFDYLEYNPELYYHSSAILASAMDTLSQKYRNKSNIYTLSDICADLTGYGRKMAAASLGIPLALNESQYLIDYLNNMTKPIYTCITPSCKIATDKIFQLITVRGMPESYLKAPMKEAKEQMNLPAYRCSNVKEMFELYFQANNFLSATNVTICEKPLEVKTPYPRIFSNELNKYGFVRNEDVQQKVENCAVIAGYHNGNFLSDMIEKLHREVSRIKFAKLHKFKEEGLEASEYSESLDRLAEFKDNYEDDFEL
ncbi:misato mitochondrial distribution and morphology regulator [Anticarsia gemmatalis]|uniref:misato mitochondrial distribution and morphology regulator n=1 Tax=Anticarsia gemmatalis TaxID=129554 RepID=UPI003F75926B